MDSYIVVYYNSFELFEYLLALLAINYDQFVFIIFMSRAVKIYLAFKDAGFDSLLLEYRLSFGARQSMIVMFFSVQVYPFD